MTPHPRSRIRARKQLRDPTPGRNYPLKSARSKNRSDAAMSNRQRIGFGHLVLLRPLYTFFP